MTLQHRLLVSAAMAALAIAANPAGAQQTPKQAVVETSAGTFIMELATESAPAQAAHFTKVAQEGGYEGTIFHRVVKNGMVQGGDPLTKDPAKREAYGSGGLNAVKAEPRAPKLTTGSVAAVLIPGKPDSAGSQFFVLLADQPALDGQYTVFARIVEGMDVLQRISATPTDGQGLATERIEVRRVTIRDTPPPEPEPFSTESVQELSGYRAVLDTSLGSITIGFFPEKAPEHVRQFLRLARAGIYDGMSVHRVVPGFVIQTGSLATRAAPLTDKQQKLVRNLNPEFNDSKHVKGIVSMARGDDPASATTSFFIVTGPAVALDGKYTVFGHVVDGLPVVEAIEAVPRTGEAPNSRVDVRTVRVTP